MLEESCTALTAANSSLREELEGARVDFETVRSELEGHREREAQLLSAQASLQTRGSISAMMKTSLQTHWSKS